MKAYNLPKYSVKEYKKQEEESGRRFEFHDGQIFALSGGSLNHGLLCGNIYSELRNGLKVKDSDCRAVTSEVKLYIRPSHSFVYPDSMVLCGDLKKSELDGEAVVNPRLIVEVLSKSTADYDRGDKFYKYRLIESLEEYVLIEQDKPVVDIYSKQPGTDLWKITRVEGMSGLIVLNSLGLTLKMADLYFDISF